jgi:hypothetical protein
MLNGVVAIMGVNENFKGAENYPDMGRGVV